MMFSPNYLHLNSFCSFLCQMTSLPWPWRHSVVIIFASVNIVLLQFVQHAAFTLTVCLRHRMELNRSVTKPTKILLQCHQLVWSESDRQLKKDSVVMHNSCQKAASRRLRGWGTYQQRSNTQLRALVIKLQICSEDLTQNARRYRCKGRLVCGMTEWKWMW